MVARKTPLHIFLFGYKMEKKNKDITENNNSTLWRTVFLALVFGTLTLVVALSVFFYIRSREPMWDNRSGVSRLVVINRSSQRKFGTEVFTMFGSGEITLNGQAIQDENTIYIGEGGLLVLEIVGLYRESLSGGVSTFSSKVLVSRRDVSGITPMDVRGTSISPTEVEIAPTTGTGDPVSIRLEGSRVETRGGIEGDYALKFQVTGWYP
jgi:hypothetical protein